MTDRVLHPSERPRKPLAPPSPVAADTRTESYKRQTLAQTGGFTFADSWQPTGPQRRRIRKKINHAVAKKRRETT